MPKLTRSTLTDPQIRTATVPAGRKAIDLHDANVEGLRLRVTSAGRRMFYLVRRVPPANKQQWTLIRDPLRTDYCYPAMTLKRARELARELIEAAAVGRDLPAERAAAAATEAVAAAQTFTALGEKFIREWAQGPHFPERPRKKSWRGDERILRGPLAPLADRPVTAITRREIRDLLDAMTARGATVYANRTLACLRKVLNFGVDKEWLTVNPIGRIAGNSEEDRTRVLTDDEIRAYWAWLESPPAKADAVRVRHYPLLAIWARLRLVLLLRSSEVLGLQWTDLQDLDGDRPVWLIPDTKNGTPHLVPLPPLAVQLLQQLRRLQPDPIAAFTGIRSARDRHNLFAGSGLRDFLPLDARRTAATNLGKLGIDEFFISRCLNHTRSGKSNVTFKYNQWQYEPQKRTALTQWAAHLTTIVQPLQLVKKRGARRRAA